MKEKLVVISGAGISAESGLQTFRDADGLWEGHDVRNVATPDAWVRNRETVLRFYNERRKQLKKVRPNEAHQLIAALEDAYHVAIITQNVDDLHERAGSSSVTHLHGELFKARSSVDDSLVYEWRDDINVGDTCEKGSQLRPHVVWFGEEVPMIPQAVRILSDADIILVIGTSLQVYPAAALIGAAPDEAPIYYIDPKPFISPELSGRKKVHIIEKGAGEGMKELMDMLGV